MKHEKVSPFTLGVRSWETVVVSEWFERLTEVLLKIQGCWYIEPWRLVDDSRRFIFSFQEFNLLILLVTEYEGTIILLKVNSYIPVDTAQHLRSLGLSKVLPVKGGDLVALISRKMECDVQRKTVIAATEGYLQNFILDFIFVFGMTAPSGPGLPHSRGF